MTKTHLPSAYLAEALRKLRERSGKSQTELAPQLEVAKQTISAWERGISQPTGDNLPKYLGLLGVSETDLDDEMQRITSEVGTVVEVPFQAAHRFPADLYGFVLRDDLLAPWASAGETVFYRMSAQPKRGDGCVLDLKDGRRIARIFDKADGSHIFVSTINPEKTEPLVWSDVRDIHKIVLRGD